MRLVIVKDNGEVVEVQDEIQDFDLMSGVARFSIAMDIRDAIARIWWSSILESQEVDDARPVSTGG